MNRSFRSRQFHIRTLEYPIKLLSPYLNPMRTLTSAPIILCCILGFVSWTANAQKLVKIKVTESIVMSMPDVFRPMTDDEIADRYFTTKRPMAMYTSMDRTVDLGINKSVTQWRESDLGIMKDFYKTNIFSLYDNVQMLNEGMEEINGRNYAYFEFVSTVKADKNSIVNKKAITKYTYIQYTIVNGYSMVFNFTCPSIQRPTWSKKAKAMMQSVSIKKSLK